MDPKEAPIVSASQDALLVNMLQSYINDIEYLENSMNAIFKEDKNYKIANSSEENSENISESIQALDTKIDDLFSELYSRLFRSYQMSIELEININKRTNLIKSKLDKIERLQQNYFANE